MDPKCSCLKVGHDLNIVVGFEPQQGWICPSPHSAVSTTVLVEDSLGTKELADHRVHFHGLFLLDLLVGTQDDTDG